jgi:hypothetical protein
MISWSHMYEFGFLIQICNLNCRLNPGRAEDLVFTHQNLCLLSRKSDEYHCGPLAMWDVGADTFEADFEGGADFLEQADRYWMSHNLKKDCLKILRHWV